MTNQQRRLKHAAKRRARTVINDCVRIACERALAIVNALECPLPQSVHISSSLFPEHATGEHVAISSEPLDCSDFWQKAKTHCNEVLR